MSQGIAQQCNDILVLGDLRNGSKLSNYSASSPPICKHDFARRSASASAKSLSVSVNGQGVKPGRWYLRIARDCLRAIRVVLVAALASRKPSRPWPLASPFTRCFCSHSLQPPDEGQRHARGASMAPPFRPGPSSQPRRFARAPAYDKPRGGVEAGGCEGTAWVPGSSGAHTRP